MKAALRLFLIVGTLSAILVMALYYGSRLTGGSQHPFKFSQFLDDVDANQIQEVEIRGSEIRVIRRDGSPYKTFAPQGYNTYNLVSDLRKNGVIVGSEENASSPWVSWVVQGIAVLILI